MRGCLFILVTALAVLVGGVWIGGPPVASAIVTAGLGLTGFSADSTTITVEADPPTDLFGGRADRVRIVATDATLGGIRAGSMDLTLDDVGLVDRTAAFIAGDLENVVLGSAAGPISVASIAIDGPGDGAGAVVRMDAGVFEAAAARSLEAALGQAPTSVRLVAPNRLALVVSGISTSADLGVADGGDLVATGPPFLGGAIILVEAASMSPFQLDQLTLEGSLLALRGKVAVSDLLR